MTDDLVARACSGYRFGEVVCAHGFTQNSACIPRPCHACGQYSDRLPYCQREDLPNHLLAEDGGPVFSKYHRAKR